MSIWYMVCWLGRSLVGLLVFPESEFPFGACCLHSFLTLSFLFWLHLDYLLSLSLSLQFSWLDYVYTMSALISSSPGGSGVQHRCGCLQIWPEHAVSVSSFLALGFWAAKGFLHLLIQSLCLELGYVMGKRNGEQANVKRVLGV
ncbi:hypothetical protein BDV09DRAFT_104622 [Aspergillus tetrazonus]